ncbi:ABC transporter ATP-binding protein [Salinarimonas ramus]|uniref:ABC transporter ATP-binding protein n=1 Tax=Salinarimonas ramus TaxID=690164 RepID=A0A917Q462_9HYPH|nr:ABC transporter ATP-binding protein [Salinarimonas ramus]
MRYPLPGGFWRRRSFEALDGVGFEIARGETLGLVGESGSGKTTIGRAVLRRVEAHRGEILFRGRDVTRLRGEALRRLRADVQVVLQDPYSSLNPRMRVLDIVAEPLVVHGRAASREDARARVTELLDLVGLPKDAVDRFPHAFSGGQRQRIGIARAIALEPALIVADEPVSALDVSVQAQVVNLLQDLQARLGASYLFISHDLAVVRHIAHRVAILYGGRIVEIGPRDAIFENPRHPYTQALLSAVPIADPVRQRARRRLVHAGEPPDLAAPPPGCRYQARCPLADARCREVSPPLAALAQDHAVACWKPL